MRMTEKQKRFCDFYIETGNAKEAAIRAGYSEKTAKQIGQENLTKPDLRAYIDERLAELKNERTADAQEVLEYLTAVMRVQRSNANWCRRRRTSRCRHRCGRKRPFKSSRASW